jgi:hypothetical protein
MRPFMDTLRELGRGDCHDELTEEMAKLVQTVRERGKAGELTLKVKLKPAGKGESDMLVLEHAISTKLPPRERPQTIMFATEDGELTRRDPRQMDLEDLRPIDGGRRDDSTRNAEGA